jgi:hypothetical protein
MPSTGSNTNNSNGNAEQHSRLNIPPAPNPQTKAITYGKEEIRKPSLANAIVGNSYYADKDLPWWLQLARDFKQANLIPLPEDRDDGI